MACNTDYTPKPKAFVKLDFPEKVYEKLNVDCPFIFELPVYSQILKKENSCSVDLDFPMQKAVLYISYFPLNNNLMSHIEQSRKLAYKHNVIAMESRNNCILMTP